MNTNQVSAAIQNGSPDALGTVSNLQVRGGKILPVVESPRIVENTLTRRESPARNATLVFASPLRGSRRRWVDRLQKTLAVWEVAERRALERAMVNLKPDVLVIDLALPGLRRVRGLPDIRRLSPLTRIVVLTHTLTDSEGVLALKAGVTGYCLRSINPEQIEKAVTAVRNGEVWVPRRLVSGLVAELRSVIDRSTGEALQSKPDPRLENLTARQRVVADLISKGACNKEIARRLNITERTVKAHLTGAFRNVGVSDRLQLAILFKEQSRSSV